MIYTTFAKIDIQDLMADNNWQKQRQPGTLCLLYWQNWKYLCIFYSQKTDIHDIWHILYWQKNIHPWYHFIYFIMYKTIKIDIFIIMVFTILTKTDIHDMMIFTILTKTDIHLLYWQQKNVDIHDVMGYTILIKIRTPRISWCVVCTILTKT